MRSQPLMVEAASPSLQGRSKLHGTGFGLELLSGLRWGVTVLGGLVLKCDFKCFDVFQVGMFVVETHVST